MTQYYYAIFGLFVIVFMLYGIMRFKTMLNVLTITIALFSIAVLISPVYYHIVAVNIKNESINCTVLLSLLYVGCFTIPFLGKRRGPSNKVYAILVNIFNLDGLNRVAFYRRSIFIAILCIAFLSFVALAAFGGGGLMWLTDSRDAYMDYRRGAGHFYALTQWGLVTAFIYYLWFRRPSRKKSLFILMVFSLLGYFLGSKGFIINFWIITTFYWHYLISPIKNRMIIVIGGFIFFLFIVTQLAQNTAKALSDTIKYFNYFDSTAHFLSMFDSVDFQHGAAMLSQLWDAVPRSLFPSKPIVYGQYLIHETLNPGLLEKGRAVGTLVWTKYYLDFGLFGVGFGGLINGVVAKVSYLYFLKQKHNPFAFIFMMQIGVIAIYNYASFMVFVFLICLFSLLVRVFGGFRKITIRPYWMPMNFNMGIKKNYNP